jgi:hypothetical protein
LACPMATPLISQLDRLACSRAWIWFSATHETIGRAAGTGAMTVHCITNGRRPKVQAGFAYLGNVNVSVKRADPPGCGERTLRWVSRVHAAPPARRAREAHAARRAARVAIASWYAARPVEVMK